MSKTIDCPVPRYAGTITLPDTVAYEVLCEWQRTARYSLDLYDELPPNDKGERRYIYKPSTVEADFRALRVPVFLLYVEAWNLKNFPANPTMKTFPATPKKAARLLFEWLVHTLEDVIDNEDEEIPNA